MSSPHTADHITPDEHENPHPLQEEPAASASERAFNRRREEALQKVFVVRLPPPSMGFRWEIRRFGSLVLSRSETEYPTSAEAKAAGEAAMAAGAGQP